MAENREIKAFNRIELGKPAPTSAAVPKTETVAKPRRRGRPGKQAEKRVPTAPQFPAEERSAMRGVNLPGKSAAETVEAEIPSQTVAAGKKPNSRRRRTKPAQPPLRMIPLGGIEEIGKNMTVYECGDTAIIVDCGMAFPDDELLGVDIVIPDFSYALSIADKIKGIFVTHGHEDHIGAIPYFLKKVNIPVYGTRLTLGLIKAKLMEHQLPWEPTFCEIVPHQKTEVGNMSVEAIYVNHSIPDACAFSIETPQGTIVHTGDFKIDLTPVDGKTTDLSRLGEIGSKGVLALMSDSTNAERPGYSATERMVGESFERLFSRAEGKRMLIASFSSNIQRVQQIIDLAERHGRHIAFSGRSMVNNTEMAVELGYLHVGKPDVIVDINSVKRYRPEDLIIITTGAQGEPMSALSRMAAGTHKQVSITSNDLIIISAKPIPGNERSVSRVINELLKKGSDVIYESMYDVHASGHACREEQKLMLTLVKPNYFVPVHGEFKHLTKHAELARLVGIDETHIMIPSTGSVIEFNAGRVKRGEEVVSGRVLVDGLGVGDVGSVVLRDRMHLAQDGLIVVVCTIDSNSGELISGPDLISRGFVYVKESEELFEEAKSLIKSVISRCHDENAMEWQNVKLRTREELGRLMYQRTKRSPMILPVITAI